MNQSLYPAPASDDSLLFVWPRRLVVVGQFDRKFFLSRLPCLTLAST